MSPSTAAGEASQVCFVTREQFAAILKLVHLCERITVPGQLPDAELEETWVTGVRFIVGRKLEGTVRLVVIRYS